MGSAIETLVNREYAYGFVTDVETDTIGRGLNEDVIRVISQKKNEPAFMLEWRLKAYRRWLTMKEPHWANIHYEPIDYQDISYYSAPKSVKPLQSLDEVDPELLRTYEKLGISLNEQKMLAGVAVDAIFDSVSVGTTMREELGKHGIIFCSFGEAVQTHPELVEKYLGTVVPHSDNFFAALNAAVFSDGSFAYVPKGVKCPMELSTYFRINSANTGQFERTLIIADEGASVSYLEGCTAPKRDENQLHAAVVELIALDNATVKYSTVQNWYAGDAEGKGGIYNFVTKRGKCAGVNSKISWTQVETGSAITWKYPSVILQGDNSTGEFYSVAVVNNRQQADTGTKMIHIGKNTKSTIVSKGISAGEGNNSYRGQVNVLPKARRAQLHAVRFDADREQVRRAHLPVHRGAEQHRDAGARSIDVEDRRGSDLLLQAARSERRARGVDDRFRFLSGGIPESADGIRCRSAAVARDYSRRICWLSKHQDGRRADCYSLELVS